MTYRNSLDTYFVPCLCFIAALNALLPSFYYSLRHQNLLDALLVGFGHSFVIWLCIGLALKSFIRAKSIEPHHLSPLHWIVILVASSLLLIPSAILSWLICIFLCLIWRAISGANNVVTLASSILIAIACRDPLCQSFLNLFADQILTFDALISGLLLQLINGPAQISANTLTQSDGHSLLILTGCSAFTNLSLALLLWYCVSLYIHKKLEQSDLLRAVFLVFLILGLNSFRLAFMAIDKSWYELLHGPDSEIIIEVLTIILPLLCIRRKNCHENICND